MNRSITLIFTVLLILGCICGCDGVKVGKTLPAWKEGELDIHFINTGRGECTYQIFPDGTTFMADASGSQLKYGEMENDRLIGKPSDDITSEQAIVDYINHFSPEVSKGHINYTLITHFHGDHCGMVRKRLPEHESGQFQITGISGIGTELILDKLMDRDFPDYTYPTPAKLDYPVMKNYLGFQEWTSSTCGTQLEKWDVGSCTQVVPLHDPDCGVSVRNYSASGCCWTGEDEESRMTMPTTEENEQAEDPKSIPMENNLSCSYILTYGDFDFFLGGDMQFNGSDKYAYLDAEAPVAAVAHKVEVMKANHHGTFNTHSKALLDVLLPDVWVCSNWRDVQPRPVTVDAVLEANPDCSIFCTNMADKNREILGQERLDRMASLYGHVVVRVAPGGKSFMVYTLEDSDQNYTVKSIHGPYYCTE